MAAKSPEAIQRHKERSLARVRANPAKYNAVSRAWYQANKGPELRAKRAAYDRKRYRSNPLAKLAKCMRDRLRIALKKNKTEHTEELVGCNFEFLKTYLEARFKDDMSWDNYGKWEVDHIIPLASAKSVDEVKRLCHYTNLQPLWSLENKQKLKKVG